MRKAVILFLRLALAAGFLSAVADRFGFWPVRYNFWGHWENFVQYTAKLNPWMPEGVIPLLAGAATALEIAFGLMLLIGFKTRVVAFLSGWLLLVFALSMTFSTGVKSALDASVFSASAAAFALGFMGPGIWEADGK